jgi:GGDEF domain-containing protein
VLTRAAFFQAGSEGLAEAFRAAEPAAVAILALEGIRSLDDDGHWDAADDIRGVISSAIKQRLRADDRIGRFDDSRFILLLRRVDSELAQLIMRELLAQVSAALRARKPYADRIELRCGLAGTGVQHADSGCPESSLRALTSTALDACVRARRTAAKLASDVCSTPTEAAARA